MAYFDGCMGERLWRRKTIKSLPSFDSLLEEEVLEGAKLLPRGIPDQILVPLPQLPCCLSPNQFIMLNDDSGTNLSQPILNDQHSLESFQTDFRCKGWNKTGTNLLSFSCWIAKKNFIYIRPRLVLLDFAFALLYAIVVGFIVGVLAWACNPYKTEVTTSWFAIVIGIFIGSLSGGSYLLRRVSRWRPMETIIREQLTRQQQKDLVVVLVAVCVDLGIDPENHESLVTNNREGQQENERYGKFLLTILDFFKRKLHMQQ